MSSRVQKGSTVFRPVVKSRARTTTASVSRQTSVAVEHPRQDGSTSQTPSIPPFSAASRSETQLSNAEPHPIPLQATPALANTISRGLDNILETQISSFQVVPPAIPIVTPAPARPTPTPILLGPRPTRPLEINSVYNSLPHEERRSQAPPTIHSTPSQSIPIIVSNNAPPDGPPPIGDPTVPPPLTNSNSVDTLNPSHSQEAEAAPRSRRRQRSQDGNSKRARKRRASNSGDEENVPERSTSRQRRSRASSSTPRPRKRVPSPPPYDPDADPGEDIDPTTMTMAELCADTGQGRVSAKAAEIQTNHTAWKVKNREKRARMRMMMEAKKYGRPDEDDADDNPDAIEPNEETSSSSAPLAGSSTALSSAPAVVDDSGSGFDYSQDLSTSRYNVQVRIGPNGETIIDEESLVVDRVDNDGTQDYTHIVESDHTKFINSATYGKRYRGSRWSAEETELFYDALAQYGENYELISYVLPGRDRKSCKNKFKIEDKKNHARIDHCLNNSVPVDMKTLSRMTGKDFSGPVPEIRTPAPLPPVQTAATSEPESSAHSEAGPSKSSKKRSRSRSQAVSERDVVVIGSADTFDS